MSKEDMLALITLLSALESWGLSTRTTFPDYLHDDLSRMLTKLCAEVLK